MFLQGKDPLTSWKNWELKTCLELLLASPALSMYKQLLTLCFIGQDISTDEWLESHSLLFWISLMHASLISSQEEYSLYMHKEGLRKTTI